MNKTASPRDQIAPMYLRDAAQPPIDPRTRKGRLNGLAGILATKTRDPTLITLSKELAAAATLAVPDDHEDQVRLSREALKAVFLSKLPLNQPLAELNLLRETAYRAALNSGTPPTAGMPWLIFREDPRESMRLQNVASLGLKAKLGRPTDQQALNAVNGILRITELLRKRLAAMLQPVLDQKAPASKAVAPAVRKFLRLEWLPGIPMGIHEVRNAWAHGQAEIKEGSLIVYDDAMKERRRLDANELWFMFAVGRMTWEVVQLDSLIQVCHGALQKPGPWVERRGIDDQGRHMFRIHLPR